MSFLRFVHRTIKGFLFTGLISGIMALTCHISYAQDEKSEKSYNFVLLRPDDRNPFWKLLEQSMRAACDDLGCQVTSYQADWDHFKYLELAENLANLSSKPDMVFFQSFKGKGNEMIRVLNQNEINHFMINADLNDEQYLEMGAPRENFKYWIGRIMPDDFSAGYQTAKILYEKAKQDQKSGLPIKMVAINGHKADGAAIKRIKGVRAFVAEHSDIVLTNVIEEDWSAETAYKNALASIKHNPDEFVYWAGADTIALGVLQAAKESSADVITTGVDWTSQAIDEIKAGNMLGSAGGHFMEGAWAAVAAFDYLSGHDFAPLNGVDLKTGMYVIDQSNVTEYASNKGYTSFEDFDFKKQSLFYGLKTPYEFDVKKMMQAD